MIVVFGGYSPVLAISAEQSVRSAVAQLASFVLAVIAGRFLARSRAAVWRLAFVGAAGMMVAHLLVDGQGAFLLLLYAPIIYVLATIGRKNIDPPSI